MTHTDSVSFWIPIVPEPSSKITPKEWVHNQAEYLLSFGHQTYHLEPNDTLRLEDAPTRSNWEIAKQVALLATLILPLAALIIKVIDRSTHHYALKLAAPDPLKAIQAQLAKIAQAEEERKQKKAEAEQTKANYEAEARKTLEALRLPPILS